jgi:sugar lactone lactonase YvrE
VIAWFSKGRRRAERIVCRITACPHAPCRRTDCNTQENNMHSAPISVSSRTAASPAGARRETRGRRGRPLAALVLALCAAGASVHAAELRSVKGLAMPESVAIGADGRIYVSEIGEFGKDGDGRIAVIDAAGQPKPFASGLDDPKGLVATQGGFFVADKTRVMKVDAKGKVSVFAAASAFPQPPLFLNDLAVDAQGRLYVSDSGDTEKGGKGGIFSIASDGKVALVVSEAQNPLIKSPNGLLFERSGKLLVADFASGDLLRLDTATKQAEKLADGFGGGDGLAQDRAGTLYITDWKGGRAWKLDLSKPGAKAQQYEHKFEAAADIALSADGKFVLLPDMKAGILYWLPR